jgi:hypothetical protein
LFSEWLVSTGRSNNKEVFNDLEDPAKGWDKLLDIICDRESRIEAGLEGKTIRSILERLATKARVSPNGLGPLTTEQITKTFEEICGYPPADQGLIVLQRLPGLGRSNNTDGQTRMFIDPEFAYACASGDILKFIQNPYNEKILTLFEGIEKSSDLLAISMCCNKIRSTSSAGAIQGALESIALKNYRKALAADVVLIAARMSIIPKKTISIHGTEFREFNCEEMSIGLGNIKFTDCIFNIVSLPTDETDDWVSKVPIFNGCLIVTLSGCVSKNGLPSAKFINTEVEAFADSTSTNEGIISMTISPGEKVLLITIKKLYAQSIGGRMESALYRGMPDDLRPYVSDVLGMLRRENMVISTRGNSGTVWHPIKRMFSRAHKLLSAPASNDKLIQLARTCRS